MPRSCCRDSVAMKLVAHGETIKREGYVIPCRWCSGYARYVNDVWVYEDEESIALRHKTQADLIDHPVRQARIAEVLGKKER